MTSGQLGPKSGKLAKGGIVIGGVTKEQIAQAKSIDLLSYLQANEPGNLKKSGRNEYRLADHDSLKISNGRWHWFSRGIGGKTALDYLIHVRGMAFVEAVKLLTDDRGVDFSFQTVKNFVPKEPERKPFTLPAASKDNSRVIAYLVGRGIDREIIDLCFERKILYESAKNHNAVFVGMDINNAARFACMRGTQGSFKQDVTGSDKRFNFCLRPSDPASRFLAVFESPADALSFASIRKMGTNAWNDFHYLSLGGTSPLALMQYLQDHSRINHVYLCLDNDRAGHEGMAKIEQAVLSDGALKKRISALISEPPTIGKDYNEALQSLIKQNKEQSINSRPHNRAAVSR